MIKGNGKIRKEIIKNDVILILSVSLVLTVFFILPSNIKNLLILNYSSPVSPGIYITHFIHEDTLHFAGNLIFYLVHTAFIYLLVIYGKTKREFYSTFFFFIFIVPILVSVTNILLIRGLNLGIARNLGFSAINSAFLGVLPFFSLVSINRIWPKMKIVNGAYSFMFFAFGIIALSYNAPLVVTVIPWIFFIWYLWKYIGPKFNEIINDKKFFNNRLNRLAFSLLIIVFALFVTEISSLFPATLIMGEGSIVDIFSHYIGLIVGTFLSVYFSSRFSKVYKS